MTDLAPVPALIQRLGRLNRRAQAGDATKPFVVIEPDNHLPYTAAELDAARTWFGASAEEGFPSSNWPRSGSRQGTNRRSVVASAWLDGGPTTTVSELREASPG